MAINPETQYPGKITPSSADYPYGEARNITVPGDGTGTPWEAALVNDIFGFQQSLLDDVGTVPTGDPEKVGASQYLEAIRIIIDRSSGVKFASVATLKAGTKLDGQAADFEKLSDVDAVVMTQVNNTTSNRGGAFYEILTAAEYGGTPDGQADFYVGGGTDYVARMLHNGIISILQTGSTGAESEDVTDFITGALDVGASHVYVPQQAVTIGSNIDLAGSTLQGNHTNFTGAFITGGPLIAINRNGARGYLRGGSPFGISTSRGRTKMLVKQALTPTGASTAYDENYALISPSSHGGIARFALSNGVGGAGGSDLGAPYDRVRTIGSFIHTDGYAIMHTPTAQSAGVLTTTINLNSQLSVATGLWASDGNTDTFAYNVQAGEFIEFTVSSDHSRKGNIAFYTSDGSTDDITVTVNGKVRPVITPKTDGTVPTNRLRVVEIEYDDKTDQVVRIDNNGPENFCYLFGVNFYHAGNVPEVENVGPDFFDKIVLSGQRDMLYAGTGASIDTVIVDGAGKFGGSFHGGDVGGEALIRLATNSGVRNIRAEMSTFVPSGGESIAVGEVHCARHIFLRYRGEIQTTPVLNIWIDYDFGLDGGCEVRGAYYAENGDVTLQTIYTGMHSTDRSLVNILGDRFVEGSPTENLITYPLSHSPFMQFSDANAQVAITPQTFEMDDTERGQHLWDNANYIKYYYTPLQGPDVDLKNGEIFRFACRYQYGEAIS